MYGCHVTVQKIRFCVLKGNTKALLTWETVVFLDWLLSQFSVTFVLKIIKIGFYCTVLCMCSTSHRPVSVSLSVCLCLCLSHVGVLLKRLNIGLQKQHHAIAQGL